MVEPILKVIKYQLSVNVKNKKKTLPFLQHITVWGYKY